MKIPRKPKLKDTSSHSSQNEAQNSIAILRFKCNYITSFGQNLYITGNIQELGSWVYENGSKMNTNKNLYPFWESEEEIICPVGMTIKYNYFIKNKDGSIIPENLPLNSKRTITMKQGGHYIIINSQGDNSIKIKSLNRPKLTKNENKKISFDSFSELISLQMPIDLISHENNKMNNEFLNETIDFALNNQITQNDRVVLVTTFLPVTIRKNEKGNYDVVQRENDSVRASLNQLKLKKQLMFLWVGMLDSYYTFDEKEIFKIDEILQELGYYIIYPQEREWWNFITYIHQILFPIFADSTFNSKNDYIYKYEECFKSFYEVNRNFAERISFVMQDKDLIVLNDIQLSLVPNILLQKNNNCSIGMYIKSLLPASDVIQLFPKHQEIIKSILLCQVIGFPLFSQARNFMTILKRFFGMFFEISKKGLMILKNDGRTILIHIKQAQVNYDFYQSLMIENKVISFAEKYNNLVKNKFAIISFDHIVIMQAIAIKIAAIDNFFKSNANLVGKVIFIMWIKEFGNKAEEEKKNEIILAINNINSKYKSDSDLIVVEFLCEFNIYKRLGVFKVCNVLLYPWLFEAHCNYAHEFVSMQSENKNYSLIIGDNPQINNGFSSIIKVNQYKPKSISEGIKNAYCKKPLIHIYKSDINYLKQASTLKWVTAFLLDMKRIQLNDYNNKLAIGMGLNFQLMILNKNFRHLNSINLKKHYTNAKNRIFFIDYENTLIELDENSLQNQFHPNSININHFESTKHKRVIKILKNLAKNENNLIFVLSKYDSSFASEGFSDIKCVGLCYENGFYYKYPNKTHFNNLVDINDLSWKNTVMKILKDFTEKTEGSFIVEKECCISWNFKNCDEYFAMHQADEIKTHIGAIFSNFEIHISDSCLNICFENVCKGAFVAKVLQKEFPKKVIDFIFAVGDDDTDETMFNYLKSAQKYFPNFNPKIKVISVTIGRKPSNAKYYINEVNECIEDLEILGHS